MDTTWALGTTCAVLWHYLYATLALLGLYFGTNFGKVSGTIIDNQKLPKKYQKVPERTRKYRKYQKLPDRIGKNDKVSKIPESTRGYQKVPKSIRKYQKEPKMTRSDEDAVGRNILTMCYVVLTKRLPDKTSEPVLLKKLLHKNV